MKIENPKNESVRRKRNNPEPRLNIKGKNKSWKMKNPSMTLNLKGSKTPKFGQQQSEQSRNKRQPKFGQRNENKGPGKLNIPNLFGKKSGNGNGKFSWKKL